MRRWLEIRPLSGQTWAPSELRLSQPNLVHCARVFYRRLVQTEPSNGNSRLEGALKLQAGRNKIGRLRGPRWLLLITIRSAHFSARDHHIIRTNIVTYELENSEILPRGQSAAMRSYSRVLEIILQSISALWEALIECARCIDSNQDQTAILPELHLVIDIFPWYMYLLGREKADIPQKASACNSVKRLLR